MAWLVNGNRSRLNDTQHTLTLTHQNICLTNWLFALDRHFSSLKSNAREKMYDDELAQYISHYTHPVAHTIHENVSKNRSAVIMYLVNLIYCVVTTTTKSWKKVNKWVVFSFSSSSLFVMCLTTTLPMIQWKTKQDFKVKLINVLGIMGANKANSELQMCAHIEPH